MLTDPFIGTVVSGKSELPASWHSGLGPCCLPSPKHHDPCVCPSECVIEFESQASTHVR